MEIALYIVLTLVWLKSIFIGSKFSFYHWIKYGKDYLSWYDKNITRAEYKP